MDWPASADPDVAAPSLACLPYEGLRAEYYRMDDDQHEEVADCPSQGRGRKAPARAGTDIQAQTSRVPPIACPRTALDSSSAESKALQKTPRLFTPRLLTPRTPLATNGSQMVLGLPTRVWQSRLPALVGSLCEAIDMLTQAMLGSATAEKAAETASLVIETLSTTPATLPWPVDGSAQVRLAHCLVVALQHIAWDASAFQGMQGSMQSARRRALRFVLAGMETDSLLPGDLDSYCNLWAEAAKLNAQVFWLGHDGPRRERLLDVCLTSLPSIFRSTETEENAADREIEIVKAKNYLALVAVLEGAMDDNHEDLDLLDDVEGQSRNSSASSMSNKSADEPGRVSKEERAALTVRLLSELAPANRSGDGACIVRGLLQHNRFLQTCVRLHILWSMDVGQAGLGPPADEMRHKSPRAGVNIGGFSREVWLQLVTELNKITTEEPLLPQAALRWAHLADEIDLEVDSTAAEEIQVSDSDSPMKSQITPTSEASSLTEEIWALEASLLNSSSVRSMQDGTDMQAKQPRKSPSLPRLELPRLELQSCNLSAQGPGIQTGSTEACSTIPTPTVSATETPKFAGAEISLPRGASFPVYLLVAFFQWCCSLCGRRSTMISPASDACGRLAEVRKGSPSEKSLLPWPLSVPLGFVRPTLALYWRCMSTPFSWCFHLVDAVLSIVLPLVLSAAWRVAPRTLASLQESLSACEESHRKVS